MAQLNKFKVFEEKMENANHAKLKHNFLFLLKIFLSASKDIGVALA